MLLTSELKQYYPSFSCTRVELFRNGNSLVVGNTPEDCVILQIESKMKAALGPNVKVSLPKAYHTAKAQNYKVLIKGVSADIKREEFENMLNHNKITFAKAESFISKRNGMPLPLFLIELKEAATAGTLTVIKLGLPKTAESNLSV